MASDVLEKLTDELEGISDTMKASINKLDLDKDGSLPLIWIMACTDNHIRRGVINSLLRKQNKVS